MTSRGRQIRDALVGAAVAGLGQRFAVRGLPVSRCAERTDASGARVSTVAGPVLALALIAGTDLPRAAVAVAGLGAAVCGWWDDRAAPSTGPSTHADAPAPHADAPATTGGPPSAPIPTALLVATGLGASALLGRRSLVRTVLDGAPVVVAAHVLRALDVRPGLALGAGLGVSLASGQAGPAGAAAALLPAARGQRTAVGAAGASALGAVLGLGLAARRDRRA